MILDMRAEILKAIEHWAPSLHTPKTVNSIALMWAICDMETSGGSRAFATLHETAYCYGGWYYQNSPDLQRLSVPWGCLAHSSFGPWQILYITAHEYGFSDDPVRLRDPMVGAEYLTKILNRRAFDRLPNPTLTDALDAWNSGRPRDRNVPTEYIQRATEFYSRHVEGPTT